MWLDWLYMECYTVYTLVVLLIFLVNVPKRGCTRSVLPLLFFIPPVPTLQSYWISLKISDQKETVSKKIRTRIPLPLSHFFYTDKSMVTNTYITRVRLFNEIIIYNNCCLSRNKNVIQFELSYLHTQITFFFPFEWHLA